MRALPRSIGPIHFVGIGGIGMSGIAEVLHNLGYRVQGTDLADSANVRRLVDLGIRVAIGHEAETLGAAEVVVISSAVKPDNGGHGGTGRAPAGAAKMLGELMRLKWSLAIAGTHGKTRPLDDRRVARDSAAGPYGDQRWNHQCLWHQYAVGGRRLMVVEADESDAPSPGLATTRSSPINPEHFDFYQSFDAPRQAFEDLSAISHSTASPLLHDHPVRNDPGNCRTGVS
jgi:UDP-N-acetylmuramate--alanine ligase